jgi:L-iditol 2-dehydrogenase
MLAAVYYGPDDLRVEETRLPEVGPGDVLLRVLSASICGTDLRILHGQHRKFPTGTVRIPGHEMVGEVAKSGVGVNGFEPGMRVFAAPNWGCGTCRQCVSGANNLCASYSAIGVTQDGAFAEYVLIPAAAVRQGNLMPISEAVDPAVAALVEPFACVLRGQNALGIRPGETVLVMGAGPIGLMHVALARLRGAGRVIVSEPNPARREQASAMGADSMIDPSAQDLEETMRDLSGGEGADAVIVAAPSRAGQEAALRATAIGGRINFFGGLPKDNPAIAFDSNLVHYKELVVTGTTACSTADCRQAAAIVSSGRVDLSGLISARLPLREAQAAFALAEERTSLKVVIQPKQDGD